MRGVERKQVYALASIIGRTVLQVGYTGYLGRKVPGAWGRALTGIASVAFVVDRTVL